MVRPLILIIPVQPRIGLVRSFGLVRQVIEEHGFLPELRAYRVSGFEDHTGSPMLKVSLLFANDPEAERGARIQALIEKRLARGA